jgi:hypothetical protein
VRERDVVNWPKMEGFSSPASGPFVKYL